MPSNLNRTAYDTLDKISEKIDYAVDELACRKLSKQSKEWQVKVALLTLEEVIREWRRK